jgi:hypothetical protein
MSQGLENKSKIRIKYIIILVIIVLLIQCKSLIIAKSKLEKCTNSTNYQLENNKTYKSDDLKEEDFNLICSEKILVSLAIDNKKLAETDTIETYINEIDSSVSKNSNEDKKKQLKNPIRINISKTPVYIEYTAIYKQTFNNKPIERVILSNIFDCEDGDLAKNPTCGWTINTSNQIIPYSQGFCCKCEFDQILGINNTDRNRGNTCKFLNLSNGSATAHCLKYHELWWSGYEIKHYNIVYEIKVFITYANHEEDDENEMIKKDNMNIKKIKNLQNTDLNHKFLNISENEINQSKNLINDIEINNTKNITKKYITLSPSRRISSSNDKKIIARLIGDFLPSYSIPDLNDNILLIPSNPINHPMVVQGPNNWLLIPKNDITFDGRECNKVGISYSAFRNQIEKCKMRIGDCLHNQIEDFYNEDIKRLAEGKPAKYLISQAKILNDAEVNFFNSNDSFTKKLSFKINGIFNTLINLEISADDLRYVVNISMGKFDFIKIENFENASEKGLLNFQITNVGKLTADFFIFYSCSEFILPINSDRISLFSYQSQHIKKNLFTSFPKNKEENTNYNHNCFLELNDINGNLLQKENIFFNTTQIVEINKQNLINSTKENEKDQKNDIDKLENKENIEIDCSIKCPNFFNFVCFFISGCWGYFVRSAIICLLLVIIIFGILVSLKNGKFLKFFEFIFICFYKGNFNQNKKKKFNSNIIGNDNENSNINSRHFCSDFFKKKKYLNFSTNNFDFSAIGINDSFSVEIFLMAESLYDFKKNLLEIRIIEIIYPENFIHFCKNTGVINILDYQFIQSKVNIKGFLTDDAKFKTLNL